ncbi:epilancin biosynthesis-related protein ElxI1 [Staphylococcus warneri]|uniref:epilancin biosynthesis-related protein ElxI1 n=1 Tax=Staphylococcus warneri TaxID=1292 RepID=UPI001F2766D4|nr:hypothetical protein [Staphylococcus warneri]MCE5000705.1 hypothetical protein [Staphylococcus warneri]
MLFLTKVLDALAYICVALLFFKFLILTVNGIFDWNLKWYFLDRIPYMAIILLISMFVFSVPSEMIKEKINKNQ